MWNHWINTPGFEVTITNELESKVHKINPSQAIRQWIKPGVHIEAGDKITEGPVDPKELLKVAGVRQVQNYILKEVKKVYQSQGIEISDKHIEVMIRQMLRKVVVVDGGDTPLNAGIQVSLWSTQTRSTVRHCSAARSRPRSSRCSWVFPARR